MWLIFEIKCIQLMKYDRYGRNTDIVRWLTKLPGIKVAYTTRRAKSARTVIVV